MSRIDNYVFENKEQESKFTRILNADSDDICRDDFESLVDFTKDLMLCNRVSAGIFASNIVKIAELEKKLKGATEFITQMQIETGCDKCRCGDSWTSRNMHESNSLCHLIEVFDKFLNKQ